MKRHLQILKYDRSSDFLNYRSVSFTVFITFYLFWGGSKSMEYIWRSENLQGHSLFPWGGYQELNSGHLAGPQDPFPLSHLRDLCFAPMKTSQEEI